MRRLYIVAAVLAVANAASLQSPPKPQIAGGENTTIEDYPYLVTIWAIDKPIQPGVIISPKHVLTSARTIALKQYYCHYQVRVGSPFQEEAGTLLDIEKFVHHPKFNFIYSGFSYDVTVGLLKEPIEFRNIVQPISILSNQQEHQGDVFTVGSWDSNSRPKKMLKTVEVTVVSPEQCQDSETVDGNPAYKRTIMDHMICGKGNSGEIDNDDRGAPLVNSNGELAGIVSYNSDTRNPRHHPAVFVNVSNREVRNFIDETTKSL